MESFLAALETRLVNRHAYQTRYEAEVDTFEYNDLLSNRQRRHSAAQHLMPMFLFCKLRHLIHVSMFFRRRSININVLVFRSETPGCEKLTYDWS